MRNQSAIAPIAVITADIVGSRSVAPAVIDDTLRSISSEIEAVLYRRKRTFHLYRGDSFQAIVKPTEALLVALLWRAGILKNAEETGLDIRLAIGIGGITYEGKTPGTSTGPAFEFSGELLDRMKKGAEARIALQSDSRDWTEAAAINCALAEGIIRKWSAAGAEAVYYGLLKGETQQGLAERFGITQASVNKRLSVANYAAICSGKLTTEKV